MQALTEEHVVVSEDPRVELFTARTAGPTARPLLVIHGGPDWDHSYLREPLVQLAESRHLIFADLRGCGRSTTGLPDDAYTPDAVTTDLITLLDAFRIQCTDVLGFSYGGLLAQRVALAAPQRVRRLIIASSSVVIPAPASAERSTPADEAWAALAANPTSENTKAHAIAGIPADAWTPDGRDELRRRLETVRFTAEWIRPLVNGTLPSARPADAVARLGAVDLRILLLHGRQDTTFPAALTAQAAAAMPNARSIVIDQAGHMAHIDQPEAWLRAVADFTAA